MSESGNSAPILIADDGSDCAGAAIGEAARQLAREAGFDAEPMVVAGGPAWSQIAAAVAQHSKRSILIVHRRD